MDEKNFFEQLKNNKLPVIVDFWAPWCGPCHAIEPIFMKLGKEYAGRVDIWQVNIDENQELRSKLHILGIPTIIVYRDGKEVTRCTGMVSLTILSWLFEAAISGVAPAQPVYALRERLVHWMVNFSRMISRVERRSRKNQLKKSNHEPTSEYPVGS